MLHSADFFFYPDVKQLRYKASGFGKALKAGPSPVEGTGWFEGHQAVQQWEGPSLTDRGRPWGPLCQGCVHFPSAPCWPGLDSLSLTHEEVFQHSPALCCGLEFQSRFIHSPTYPAASQHEFHTCPISCFPNFSLVKWLWKDLVPLPNKSLPPCWPSCPPRSGNGRITKFAAVGTPECSVLPPPGHHKGVSLCPHILPSEPVPHTAHSCCPLTCAGFSCSLKFCYQQEPALSIPSTAQRMQNSPGSFVFGGRTQLFVLETIGTTSLIHTCSSFCYSSIPVLPSGNIRAREPHQLLYANTLCFVLGA